MEKHASRSKESTEGKSRYDILANLNFLREPLFTANYLPLSMLGSGICICILHIAYAYAYANCSKSGDHGDPHSCFNPSHVPQAFAFSVPAL